MVFAFEPLFIDKTWIDEKGHECYTKIRNQAHPDYKADKHDSSKKINIKTQKIDNSKNDLHLIDTIPNDTTKENDN